MPSRVSAFVIWAVVALGAAYWALRLLASPTAVPSHAAPAASSLVARADLTRLLGATAATTAAASPAPATSSRFRLVGVAAPKSGAVEDGGVALIAVDGKAARPYRVGAVVDGDLVLAAVERRSASLGPRDGDATLVLELPALPPAATGSLPPAPSLSGQPAAVPPPAATAPPPGAAPQLGRVPRTDVEAAPPPVQR